jgi:hypothetical protein
MYAEVSSEPPDGGPCTHRGADDHHRLREGDMNAIDEARRLHRTTPASTSS